MKKKIVAVMLSAVLFIMGGTTSAFASEVADVEPQTMSAAVQTEQADADTEETVAETVGVADEAVAESVDEEELADGISEDTESSDEAVEAEALDAEIEEMVTVEDAETMPQYETAANGIYGNGTNGIYIDINSAPFTTYANKSYGQYAYGIYGCAWFASARACQLTGTDTPIFSGSSWYNTQYANYGYSRGSTVKAKALACYESHVSVVEAVSGDTVTISEGGYNVSSYANYGYCRIATMSVSTLESSRGGAFLGYVYLDSSSSSSSISWTNLTVTPSETDAYIYIKAIADAKGSFTQAGVVIWQNGVQIVSKTEDVSYYRADMAIWYYITDELKVTLTPGTTYTYQFFCVYNGTKYTSGIGSFTTTSIPVTDISLDKLSCSLAVGNTALLTASVAPTNATDKTVTWSSSDTSVATVSSSGLVTAVKAGTATITAKSSNGKLASCEVTVTGVLPVTSLKIGGRASNALRLNWTANTDADGYIIEQYKSGSWTRIAKITKNTTTTYRVSGLSAATTYKFRIKCFSYSGSSAIYSTYVSVSGKTKPAAMSGVKIGGRASNALRVSWSKNSSADGYIVEQYKSGSWTRIAKVTSNSTTSYRVSGLSAYTTYKFRVKAYAYSGNSAVYSAYKTISGKTRPTSVSGFKIGGTASNALRVNWTKNSKCDGYIVEILKNGSWLRVAKIKSNSTTTYRIGNLSAKTGYTIRIRSYGFDGSTAIYSGYTYTYGTTN